MPIRIVRETECFVEKLEGGGTLYWRRLPSHVRHECNQRHTERGVIDQPAAIEDMLAYCITGWGEDVLDTDGSPLLYQPELVRWLPEDVKVHMVVKMGLSDPGEPLLKNSNGSLRPVSRSKA